MPLLTLWLTIMKMKMKTPSDIDDALSDMVHRLSEFSNRDILALHNVLERAYVHVMVEVALRDADRGVSASLSSV